MSRQVNTDNFNPEQLLKYSIASNMVTKELTGLYGSEVLNDMYRIIRMYKVYEEGAEFVVDGSGDYVHADLRYKIIRALINKEARFLFSVPPDLCINGDESQQASIGDTQELLNLILQKNGFSSKLVKAARDCFIGERIAIVTNFNDAGISVSFIPSLEFVFETDPADVDKLTKFIQFYGVAVNDEKDQQRLYRKKWWLADDGFCWFSEGVYDGLGNIIEEIFPDTKTLLTWIPVEIINNDGLSGDPFGVSEIEALRDSEMWYSKLSNKDIDSLRKGSDQIKYALDISTESTKNLSLSAGAFWDLTTDMTRADGVQGKVGVLDNDMAYSSALDTTLHRIKTHMYDQLDVPDTSSDALKGIISSGKTLKAIYWPLVARCNEKMLVWRPALERVVKTIIEGARLYPNSIAVYEFKGKLIDLYTVSVDNAYPLPEDEEEEKSMDLAEVGAQTMSRKSYIMKWRGLTPEKADEEINQMMLEKQMLETETFNPDATATLTGGNV